MFSLFRVFTVFLFFSQFAFAQNYLIFEFSDFHSNAEAIPNLLRTWNKLSKEFKTQHPDGKVIVIANGDFSGSGRWTDIDAGNFAYDFLAQMAQKYEVALVLGNHEGFDFLGSQFQKNQPAHSVFYKQNLEWVKNISAIRKKETRVLAANITPGNKGSEIFGSYQDVDSKLRIVGMVLSNLFQEMLYDFNSEVDIFKPGVRPLLAEAQNQILKAADDGIETIVFAVHEKQVDVEKFTEELLDWKNTQPQLSKINIPVVYSGHEHEVHAVRKQEKTWVIDAGAFGDFSAVKIENSHVVTYKQWSRTEQQENNKLALPYLEKTVVEKIQKIIDQTNLMNAQEFNVQFPNIIAHTADSLKKGQQSSFGNAIADAYMLWGQRYIEVPMLNVSFKEIVGIVNALSFWHVPELFQRKNITLSALKQALPFYGEVRVIVVRGEELRKIINGLKNYGKQSSKPFHTPYLSKNLRLGLNDEVQVLKEGNWQSLDNDENFLLVIDPFTGKNGYKISALDEAYQKIQWESMNCPVSRDLLFEYLPKALLRAQFKPKSDVCDGNL